MMIKYKTMAGLWHKGSVENIYLLLIHLGKVHLKNMTQHSVIFEKKYCINGD